LPYEVRVNGKPTGWCETPEQAEAKVCEVIAHRPNAECEVFDSETGEGLAPAATKEHRDYLTETMR
jgi:hypothetical protein